MWHGPRIAFFSMLTLSACGASLLIIYWDDNNLIPIFIIMAKFGMAACFSMVFVLHVQVVPVLYSASSFGFCNMFCRFVTIISPLVAQIQYPTPLICEVVVTMSAAVISLLLITDLPKYKLKAK